MAKVNMELMLPHEFVEAQKRASIAYVPTGPIEWHGPHMPLGIDAFHAAKVASEVAQRVGGVVVPTFFLGADSLRLPGNEPEGLAPLGLPDSAHVVGMDFPGMAVKSMYIDEAVLGVLFRDVIRALERQGFRMVVLISGHGAPNHLRLLRRLAMEETRPGLSVMFLTAWAPPAPPAGDGGHAERVETSVMCGIGEPEVRLDLLPHRDIPLPYKDFGIIDGLAFDGFPNDGFVVRAESDPRNSSAEEGKTILSREVERMEALVRSHYGSVCV
jgi:creatinine amidohydrolase